MTVRKGGFSLGGQMLKLMQGDCLELMQDIPDGSVDLVLTDPPYGTTACRWDTVIPFEPMWAQLKRVAKKSAAIVLTASMPFTAELVQSNRDMFRYRWVWDKVNRITGFLDAKKRPLRVAEDVCVFYTAQPTYNPQMFQGVPYRAYNGKSSTIYREGLGSVYTECPDGLRFPQDILRIKADNRGSEGRVHPTQKPVALLEYLIRTYTNEGETVLDFTMGSGSTGVACINTNRSFIGIELDADYFKIAEKRIADAQNKPEQISLIANK
jgi:DNA modification methylase